MRLSAELGDEGLGAGALLHVLEETLNVMAGGFAGNAFEYAIEVSDAVESAIVGNGGDAVVIPVRQLFTGLVDAHFIKK